MLPQQKLLIRADAGGLFGTGHVMRSIAIAQAWIERGGSVALLSGECPGGLIERLGEEGIDHHQLPTAEIGGGADCAEVSRLAKELGATWALIDGYQFETRFHADVREHCRTVVIDDYGHCSHWTADVLLNPNVYALQERYAGDDHQVGQFLLGSTYSLLRNEFRKSPPAIERPEIPPKRFIITFGGTDPENYTTRCVDHLNQIDLELELVVVVGAGFAEKEALEKTVGSSQHQIQVQTNVDNMAQLYQSCDAVISAGGSSCYEWIYYGRLGFVCQIADNQKEVVSYLKENRLAFQIAGSVDDSFADSGLEMALKSPEEYVDLERLRNIIDGQGSVRVVNAMLNETNK